jgi:alpha-N-acetylglucosamine transferase
MFDMAPLQECKQELLQDHDRLADGTPVCEPYVFSGVPQNPLNETDKNINVGSMVFSPSEKMHSRLLQNYRKTDRYDCTMAEQAFLNWQFSMASAFPPSILEREWGGFFPDAEEEGKLNVVHEKIWVEDDPNMAPWLKQEWGSQWQNMLAFYNSVEFAEARKRDGTLL